MVLIIKVSNSQVLRLFVSNLICPKEDSPKTSLERWRFSWEISLREIPATFFLPFEASIGSSAGRGRGPWTICQLEPCKFTGGCYCWWFRNPANQLIDGLSHYIYFGFTCVFTSKVVVIAGFLNHQQYDLLRFVEGMFSCDYIPVTDSWISWISNDGHFWSDPNANWTEPSRFVTWQHRISTNGKCEVCMPKYLHSPHAAKGIGPYIPHKHPMWHNG